VDVADASVRLANVEDVSDIAAVQAASWRDAFAGTLPPSVLDQLQGADAVDQWRLAVIEPPSPRHRLLVALAGTEVVGFAAIGPADDPDSDPLTDAELLAVGVLPDRAGEGHGSRLVNASVDHLRADGFVRAHVWLTDTDQGLREFLESAGWADDGARRRLDLRGDGAVVIDQLRLDASISEPA
jgi:GNAT superfamily N-acetyltransferase